MLIEKLPKRRPNKPEYTIRVMLYELGDLSKALVYAKHCEEVETRLKRRAAYNAEARKALASIITQCRLMAEQMNYAWEALILDGEEEFLERMQDLSKGTI